jgi:hypothetical protein
VFYLKKNLKILFSCLCVYCADLKRINQFFCDGSDFFFRDYSSSRRPVKFCVFLYFVSNEGSQIALATYEGSVFFEWPEDDPMMGRNM